MKSKLCLVVLAISAMLGCTHTARLYPVQGPLTGQVPVPVLMAKISGAFTPGTISFVLPDGEVCKGRWNIVNPVQAASGAHVAAAPINDMAPVWDSIYGQGYYVSRVLGARYYAQAVVAGDHGTVLNVEMYRPLESKAGEIGAIKGVAKDSKNNLYKLVL